MALTRGEPGTRMAQARARHLNIHHPCTGQALRGVLKEMPWDRLYSSARWRRFTRLYLRMHPACVRCTQEGETYEATIVHHVVEFRLGDSDLKFWVGPFEATCKKHHLQIHGWPAMRDYQTDIGLDGYPLDPNNPFWKASRRQEEQERRWQKDSVGKKATP